jgi:formiminotetrahydrofolate cyclodeaminase
MHNLTKLLTQEISLMKQKKEIIHYDTFLANGLKMISDIKGDLVKLAFKEYEPFNIICNTLQIP